MRDTLDSEAKTKISQELQAGTVLQATNASTQLSRTGRSAHPATTLRTVNGPASHAPKAKTAHSATTPLSTWIRATGHH